MEKIIYSKYSNERAKQFQIGTNIVYDEMSDKKIVEKIPLTKNALKHINNMYDNYKNLSEEYKKCGFVLAKCENWDMTIRFDFIEGKTLEEKLDMLLLNSKYDEIMSIINEYVDKIKLSCVNKQFKKTQEFINIFGDVDLPNDVKVSSLKNVDILFNNIIINNEWYIIDYEWVFSCDIPINFILFRAIYYYIYTSSKRVKLTKLDLYRKFGISDYELDIYKSMENNFQKYILGKRIPLRDLYGCRLNSNYNIKELIEKENSEKSIKNVQVFFDYGNGFNENNSDKVFLIPDKDDLYQLEININQGAKSIRIDPCNTRCVLRIESIVGINSHKEHITFESNAVSIGNDLYLFQSDDPQIRIDVNNEYEKVFLKFQIIYILNSFEIIAWNNIYENYRELNEKKINLNKIIRKNNKLEKKLSKSKKELDNYILHYNAAMEQKKILQDNYNIIINSTCWRMTKPLRAVSDLIKKILKSNKYTHLICKGVKCLKKNGIQYTFNKVKQKSKNIKEFSAFTKKIILTEDERIIQLNKKFTKNIMFSIVVPIYNTPKQFLCEMIDSCIGQTYGNWELCLADGSDGEHDYVEKIIRDYMQRDKRIKYKKLVKNDGISENTNECIKMSCGDYIALFDHDDLLHPSALYEYMQVICEKNADFIYCDELTFQGDLNNVVTMHFKPDFAIDNLRANNYICHFTVFSAELLKETGLFRKEFDGSQDHDMILRLTEKAKQIVHVPKILYFWRSHPNSVSADINSKTYAIDAGRRAVKEHLNRCGLEAIVESSEAFPTIYRLKYKINEKPLISIIIPNKDNTEMLQTCIDSIIDKSTYKNIEILVIENNSVEDATFDFYDELELYDNVKVIKCEMNGKFNYSYINNFGVKYAKGKYLLFLNNDIEVISENWLEEMLMYCQRSDVGAVGAKLYYPNDTIQHAGVILKMGKNRCAGHCHHAFYRNSVGYIGRLFYAQDFSAVTAACMMVKKEVFNKVNGFDESFAVAYNDVDLCMKIRKEGYLIVWTPYAELYHYESVSRGYDESPEKKERLANEADKFKAKWKLELDKGDPYYNPNLTLDKGDFSLNDK